MEFNNSLFQETSATDKKSSIRTLPRGETWIPARSPNVMRMAHASTRTLLDFSWWSWLDPVLFRFCSSSEDEPMTNRVLSKVDDYFYFTYLHKMPLFERTTNKLAYLGLHWREFLAGDGNEITHTRKNGKKYKRKTDLKNGFTIQFELNFLLSTVKKDRRFFIVFCNGNSRKRIVTEPVICVWSKCDFSRIWALMPI